MSVMKATSNSGIKFFLRGLQGFWLAGLMLTTPLWAATPVLEHEPPAALNDKSPGVQITQDTKGITYQATTSQSEPIPGGELKTTILQLTRRYQSGTVTDIHERKIEKIIQNGKEPQATETVTIKTVRQTDEKGQMLTTTTKEEKYTGPASGEAGKAKSETIVLPPVSKTTDGEGKEIYFYHEEGTEVRETRGGDGRVEITYQNKGGKTAFAETRRAADGATTVIRREGKDTHIERYDPAGALIEKQSVLADGKRVQTQLTASGEETWVRTPKGQILKHIKRRDDGSYTETIYVKGQPAKMQDFDREGKLLRTSDVAPASQTSLTPFPKT